MVGCAFGRAVFSRVHAAGRSEASSVSARCSVRCVMYRRSCPGALSRSSSQPRSRFSFCRTIAAVRSSTRAGVCVPLVDGLLTAQPGTHTPLEEKAGACHGMSV